MRICRRSFQTLKSPWSVRNFSSVTQPTLDVELPGLPPLNPAGAREKPTTKISTLSNGMKVATEETYGAVATMGVFVNAGSQNETFENNGVSHFLEHMAFKSTDSSSSLRLMRDMDNIGAAVGAQSSRDCIVYSAECLRDNIDTVVKTLADTILQPKLAPWDLDEQREVIGHELANIEENAQQLVTELVHNAAYGENTPLGRGLWCPQRNLEKISVDQLKEFLSNHFKPSNMVLSAAGVNHEEFVSTAEKYFTQPANYQLSDSNPVAEVESIYRGGFKTVEGDSDLTHLALAFNPGSWHSEDLLDICTMHFLLGGGGSFSAGGPGKGMYSRLYLNVLNKFHWVDSATAFNTLYKDSGLFGIYGSAWPVSAGDLVKTFCDEFLKLRDGNLTEEEISRAKNQTKSSLLMKLEERQVLFEDIGRQLMVYEKRMTPEELCEKVDKVNADSIKKVATKMLKTKPTLAAFGNTTTIPRYEDIVARLQ